MQTTECLHINTTKFYDLTYCKDCGHSIYWTCPDCGKKFPPRLKSTSAHRAWHRRQAK